jgi:hypothetical protein
VKSFARVSKISNVGGRADYITNPKRQENIVATSEKIDWKPYQDFERNNQKTFTANNEGREVILAIPNEWSKLSENELKTRAQTLAVAAVGKETDMQWAVHWNKSKTNLHMHVLFSERQRCGEVGKYDRDIYLTEDGKVARTKAQRAKNADGSYKPPKHRKGEEKGGFTIKDTRYKHKSWAYDMKAAVDKAMQRFGVTIEPPAPLSQYHEGKGKDAPIIAQKNAAIRENNAFFDFWKKNSPVTENALKQKMLAASQKGNIFGVTKVDGKWAGVEMTFSEWQKAKPLVLKAAEEKKAAQTVTVAPMGEPVAKPAQPNLAQTIKPKTPTEPPIPWQIAPIKKALNDLEAAIKKKNQPSAAANVSRFKFKEHKAAKEADEKRISTANDEIKTATDTLRSHGVSLRRNGEEIPIYALKDTFDVAENAEERITALRTEAATRAKDMNLNDFSKQVKGIKTAQPLERGNLPKKSFTHER